MSRWTTIDCTGTPHCRHENGFAAYKGKLYLFGGRRIQPVDIFDPKTNRWTSASAPPMEIHHFQPVVIGTEIWLLGTMTGEFPRETPLETVFVYEPETDTWREGPPIPEARRRGAAGCVHHSDGWIYIVGGIVDGHHSGTQAWFDRLHPATGEWQILPDAPNKRDHAPCAILGDKLYFFSGRETGRHNGADYNALFSATIGDVDVYDFSSGQWSVHDAALPIETAAGGAGVINEKIHYVGGEAGRMEAFTEMQVFDAATDKWTIGPALNRARHGTNCCVHDGKLWIAAGSGARGGAPELTSIECLEIE
ncbi:Kelch repeat-containing protein [Roseobacter sp. EG26]|uniref:Kelch repeat-containing protein n=1 Tax=Roseobacter sp. EG26 TaxID=3412477 RepID=UPI003CE5844E